jgi:hypothetical protein
MSDYNRGSSPQGSDPPLAFEDRRRPTRGGPAPVTLILSLVLLVAVGGGVYYMYRGGARSPGEPPQPVGAPVRDVKVAAPPQTPAQDPAAGLSIYKVNQGDNVAAPAFVAPPEQPVPRPVASAPLPAVAASSQPPSVAASASTSSAPTAAAPVIASAKPAAKPVAKLPAKPVTIDKILADNSGVKSPAKPVKPAAAAAPASPPRSDAAPGGAVVQIGAFSTKVLADAGWNSAAATAPGFMAGKGKNVVPVTKADGSILYRTSITGFGSHADAEALCAKLKAAGGSCFVR